jgi:hypothetical protein
MFHVCEGICVQIREIGIYIFFYVSSCETVVACVHEWEGE